MLEADDSIFNKGFLDEAHTDKPRHIWSVQKSQCLQFSVIRHLVWKGYTAWSKVGSQIHGGVYIGDGLKNNEFCFLL